MSERRTHSCYAEQLAGNVRYESTQRRSGEDERERKGEESSGKTPQPERQRGEPRPAHVPSKRTQCPLVCARVCTPHTHDANGARQRR